MKRHASFQGEITEHVSKFVKIFKRYSSKNSMAGEVLICMEASSQ